MTKAKTLFVFLVAGLLPVMASIAATASEASPKGNGTCVISDKGMKGGDLEVVISSVYKGDVATIRTLTVKAGVLNSTDAKYIKASLTSLEELVVEGSNWCRGKNSMVL